MHARCYRYLFLRHVRDGPEPDSRSPRRGGGGGRGFTLFTQPSNGVPSGFEILNLLNLQVT